MDFVVLLLLPLILIYMLPTWSALVSRHRRLPRVTMLNILFGWTVIGWILAMGWAVWPTEHYNFQKTNP